MNDLQIQKLTLAVAGLGIAVQKALTHAGLGLMEASQGLSDARKRDELLKRGESLLSANSAVSEEITKILRMIDNRGEAK